MKQVYLLVFFITFAIQGCSQSLPSSEYIGLSREEVRNRLGEPDSSVGVSLCEPTANASEEDFFEYYNATEEESWYYNSTIPGVSKRLIFNVKGKVFRVE